MKKLTMITALILAFVLTVCLGACGGKITDNDPSGSAGDAGSISDSSDGTEEQSSQISGQPEDPAAIRDALLTAFRSDGHIIKRSPVKSYLKNDPERDGNVDLTSADTTLAGTYSLKFSDLDKDGREELLAFRLVLNDDPVRTGSGDELSFYDLYITVYDLNENGEIVTDSVKTDANTSDLYYPAGNSRNYAAEKDGTIAVLTFIQSDMIGYGYSLYSYKDGRITKGFERDFNYCAPYDDTKGAPEVFGGIPVPGDGWEMQEGTEFKGDVGSDEIVKAFGDIDAEIKAAGFEPWLFPLQPTGELMSGDVFEDRSDLRFGPEYEYDRLYLYIGDKTNCFETVPSALKVGGTRIVTIEQSELRETHDSSGLRAEYDEQDAIVSFYVGEHTANNYIAITPLRETKNGVVRIVDKDDEDNYREFRWTADDNGKTVYDNINIPDPGAIFGVAPSKFVAVDAIGENLTTFSLYYDVTDPAFGGKTPEQIMDEYTQAAEDAGFRHMVGMPDGEGGIFNSFSGREAEYSVRYFEDDYYGGKVIEVEFTLS